MTVTSEASWALAPTGVLRATINLGNPLLAHRTPDGELAGRTVNIARRLAERLGLPLELVAFASAREAVAAVEIGNADVGFFAIDPAREKLIAFTEPYYIIEGCYLVREQSPITSSAEVDRTDRRVVVGEGSAYDLYLTRALKLATIERVPTSPEVVARFLQNGADVAAGVRQQLEADAAARGGLRLLPESFMDINQAMGVRRSYGPAAAFALREFIRDLRSDNQEAVETRFLPR